MQSGALIPDNFPLNASPVVQTSGVIHLYAAGSAGDYNYSTIQNRLSKLVKKISVSKQVGD